MKFMQFSIIHFFDEYGMGIVQSPQSYAYNEV